jgi:uncharacterized protein (TIGR01777 family)
MALPKRIVITGASGFVGHALGTALGDRGDFVIALSRGADQKLPFAKGTITWDQLPAVRDVDAIVHLAGENVAQRWTSRAKERIVSSRVGGLAKITDAVQRFQGRKPTVLVSASATGYYGDRGDEMLPEEAHAGIDFLATTCVQWEKAALAVGLPRTVILRFGMVLGRGGALEKMATPFRLGVGGRLGSGEQWVSWIHLKDLVALLVRAIDREQMNGVYNAVSPEPVRNAEFSTALAGVFGKSAPIPVPAAVLRLGLGDMSSMLLGGQRVVPRRLVQDGFHFQYPKISEALRAVVRES